jgi:hypothetical protein
MKKTFSILLYLWIYPLFLYPCYRSLGYPLSHHAYTSYGKQKEPQQQQQRGQQRREQPECQPATTPLPTHEQVLVMQAKIL